MASTGQTPVSSEFAQSPPKKHIWKNPTIIAAGLTAVATIIAAIIATSQSRQQTMKLSGLVHDPRGAPIRRAELTLILPGEAAQDTSSDEHGSFLFPKAPALAGKLLAEAKGYGSETKNVTPESGLVELTLYPDVSGNQQNDGANNKPDPGQSRGEANIGWSYETGQGGIKDYALAMKWYRKAADDGDMIANWNIARLYENGLGIPRDLEVARQWYQRAADMGDDRSKEALKHLGQNPRY